jgi:bifunctional lysine-specific demethylase and histidyl-hydroxylase NO66
MAPASSSSSPPPPPTRRSSRRRHRPSLALLLLLLQQSIAAAATTSTHKHNATTTGLLESLLGPIPGASQFAQDFWQRKPAVIQRRNPTFYQPIIRSTDLDTILAFSQEGWKLVRRAKGKDGEWWSSSPPPELDRGVNDGDGGDLVASALRRVERAHGAFARGFSLVVDRMDERHEGVGRLVEAVEAELGHRVGANVYWTPGQGSQAFEAHFDWMVRFVYHMI